MRTEFAGIALYAFSERQHFQKCFFLLQLINAGFGSTAPITDTGWLTQLCHADGHLRGFLIWFQSPW